MDDVTIIKKGGGVVECRICGLNFVPESGDDREEHDHMHRLIICGGIPLAVRELLKSFGWALAYNDGGVQRLMDTWQQGDNRGQETGKRAVVFAYWVRALSNGIPENDCDRFMAAYFAFVDAKVSGDETLIEKAQLAIEPWGKYGG